MKPTRVKKAWNLKRMVMTTIRVEYLSYLTKFGAMSDEYTQEERDKLEAEHYIDDICIGYN